MTGASAGPRRRDVFSRMSTTEVLRCLLLSPTPPVTYSAVLPVGEETALFVSAPVSAGRRRRRTLWSRRAGLLPAGGAGAALVSRRHLARPAGRRQPDRPLDGLPVAARRHRRPGRSSAGAARGAACRALPDTPTCTSTAG